MSDAKPNAAWLVHETARRYKTFTQKTTMYQDLSQVMVKLANIKPGMRVLDLGCGTGITTQATLPYVGDQGRVYALDVSEAMLNIAHQDLPPYQVTSVHADAASFADLIDEPIDRVICNSVFWQFRNKPLVMAELQRVLKPDGLFVFNAPEPYFIFESIPRSNKVAILFKQLAAERYGVGTQDVRTMAVFLNNHHFELVTTEVFERTRSAEESYLFMQLPVSTAWMDPPLDYETRMALLEEARQLATSEARSKRRWMYFVTRPRRQLVI
jgi:ubiquinone/menaquinone biosynthesis C-methylase UbiE